MNLAELYMQRFLWNHLKYIMVTPRPYKVYVAQNSTSTSHEFPREFTKYRYGITLVFDTKHTTTLNDTLQKHYDKVEFISWNVKYTIEDAVVTWANLKDGIIELIANGYSKNDIAQGAEEDESSLQIQT